jgi:hypothetical protein
MAANKYFGYLNPRTPYANASAAANGKQAVTGPGAFSYFGAEDAPKRPGIFSQEGTKEKQGSFPRRLKKISDIGIKGIQRSESEITKNAQEYAQFLAGQIERNERTPLEASDLFADFGLAYGVPGAFKTAAELGSMTGGALSTSSVEKYRPYQEFAAKTLGISWNPEDYKGIEAAAASMGKTSPEAFSRLLGQVMLNSPEYIKKNPLAFSANLPAGGYYGVGYQAPGGGFTGTYRFKPPSTVSYS